MKIAVVGGGVVGLTTALQLQQELRNVDISVYASDFDNTTSHVAAGIFRISPSFSGPSEQITRKWVKDSYDYYDTICKSPAAAVAGITNISGYIFANASPDIVKAHWIENVVPLYRRATEAEFKVVGGNWKYGSFFTTLLTECNLYLPWARQKLQENGCKLMTKEIDSLKDIASNHDVVMNCTGLGARELCNDKRIVPIRGQVIKVKAPWLKTFFYGELDTYVIPGFDGVVTLGGTRSFESQLKNWCEFEASAIRNRCDTLIPSLSSAKIVARKIGFRPHRESGVRVEPEIITAGGRKLVIHNYGHGGYGVSTAPGTAKYAIELAKQMHRSSVPKL